MTNAQHTDIGILKSLVNNELARKLRTDESYRKRVAQYGFRGVDDRSEAEIRDLARELDIVL